MMFPNIHVYYLAGIAYLGIFLFGWETGVAGGVISQKGFQEAFSISAAQKDDVSSNIVSVLQGGAFFGSIAAAPLNNYLGRKRSLFLWDFFITLGSLLQVIPGVGGSLGLIYAGRVIAGFGIGGVTSVAPGYVSECAPANARGRITGLFQIIVAAGVTLSYFTNYGIGAHIPTGPMIWRIAFGLQLIPCGLMALGLPFATESPRWLARKGRSAEALRALAFLRRRTEDDEEVVAELAEIEATVREEVESRAGFRQAVAEKGNRLRFAIAFIMFVFQQWSGQNSVGYYAPQIFASIGYSGTTSALLASGIYGIVKLIATFICVTFGIERFGRRWSLFGSAVGMGTLFFIVGAILKTHPPITGGAIQPASQAMAAMIYLYCVAYSFGWGPTPWIYVADIFNNQTRHLGIALASATQWLFNYAVSKVTPYAVSNLGWKVFIMFGTINLGGMAVFSFFLPETKGKSLEEMDVVFGSISAQEREKNVNRAQDVLEHHDASALGRDGLHIWGSNAVGTTNSRGNGGAADKDLDMDVEKPSSLKVATRDQ